MPPRDIQTTIHYLGDCHGKPAFYGRQRALDNLPLAPYPVTIENLRASGTTTTLDREGFALVAHRSAASDVFDPAARATYRRELEALILDVTGARRAVAFTNGVIRRSERSSRFRQDGTTVLGRFAHCDFSPNPAGSRVWAEQLLPPDEAGARLAGRFAIYNVWRVLSPPPQDTPLALCDVRTVAPHDQVCSDCVVDEPGQPEIRFENSVFRHAPDHRWCYFSDMTRDEVLIFTGFDSAPGAPPGVPHVAFDDPTCPPDAPPRESIDDRVVAFFD
jgi:hypothetical protein